MNIFQLQCYLSKVGILLVLLGLPPLWATATFAQQPVQCATEPQQAAERVRVLLAQAQEDLLSRQLNSALTDLSRGLQLLQNLEDPAVKAEQVRLITEVSDVTSPQGILIEALKQAQASGQVAQILPLLSQMQQITQSLGSGYSYTKIQALTALAQHYTILKQPGSAAAALAQAQSAVSRLQGNEFKAKALTTIAAGRIRLNANQQGILLLDQALSLAQPLHRQDALRRAWLLQPIAVNYAKAGALDQALQLAQRIPLAAAEGFYRAETVAQVATEAAQAGQVARAVELARQIKRTDIQATALTQIAEVLVRARQGAQAIKLLDQAVALVQTAVEPSQVSSLLLQITPRYAQAGQLQKALQIAKSIPDLRVKMQTLSGIANTLQAGQQSEAVLNQILKTLQAVPDPSQGNELLQEFVETSLAAGRYSSAFRILQGLHQPVGFENDVDSLVKIAEQAAAAGDFKIATAAAGLIPQGWVDQRNWAWQGIAVAYAKTGQPEQALQIVNRIDNYGSYPHQVRTLAAIAGVYIDAGKTAEAQAMLQQAQQIANRLEKEQKTDALTAIAIQYARAGQGKQAAALRSEALQRARSITDSPSHQDFVLQNMVQQYLNADQYGSALEVALTIRSEGNASQQSLSEVINQMIQAGQLDQAQQAAILVQAPQLQTALLLKIADHYLQRGALTQADNTLTKAVSAAKRVEGPEARTVELKEDLVVDDPQDRGSFLEAIALKYAEARRYNQARQVAQLLQDSSLRQPLLQRIACHQAIKP